MENMTYDDTHPQPLWETFLLTRLVPYSFNFFMYCVLLITVHPVLIMSTQVGSIMHASGGGLASGVRQGEDMTRGVYCWGPVVSVSQ